MEWISFLGVIGRSLDRENIAAYVFDLCRKYPSNRWIQRSLRDHPDRHFVWPRGVD